MARAPNPKAQEAEVLFRKGMKLVEIASQLNLPDGTVRRWKSTYKWDNERSENKSERSHKRGAPKGNKNAVGNDGGAPLNNKNAEKNGLFAKYLPDETLEIIQTIEQRSTIDILWDQIMIAYAAICRAQQIMYVKDREDKTIEKVMEGSGNVDSEKWEVQQAWDKHANFMKSQARAQAELRSMIKQYNELLSSNPDLVTEEQKARIEKLKVDTAKAKGEDNVEELDKLDKVLAEIKGVI
ncbi:phage terminase small subunit [Cellulosilyticum lentocellum]|uniref:Phage terminase small subunit n=1 Tax=Cellulosilyticum lentocellum (strain ATCC 49066 / DSM 5427 / NCIMB 11756 / RHM5) TaxID=642492 RepID=F2JPJ8_CELLD|nr:phage terminase small subunit [Cellulosilyticum lentocellum]ADZ82546.1 Phage terminase small subunit [Cellulosilyticum lentocellum DSM 5427]